MVDKTQLEGMVEGLTAVKEEFWRNKAELEVSIRKDVVAVELKSIIENTDNYLNLKAALKEYIDNLYSV
jgi:hypothetical protein